MPDPLRRLRPLRLKLSVQKKLDSGYRIDTDS